MTNGKNSFLQVVKLPNVRGRVRYISDPKRQENLYATFTNVESKNIGLTFQKKIRRISEKAVQRANALRRES
mgnify:CR=1 FL=1